MQINIAPNALKYFVSEENGLSCDFEQQKQIQTKFKINKQVPKG